MSETSIIGEQKKKEQKGGNQTSRNTQSKAIPRCTRHYTLHPLPLPPPPALPPAPRLPPQPPPLPPPRQPQIHLPHLLPPPLLSLKVLKEKG